MKAIQALAELDNLGSSSDPVLYRPWCAGDESVEVEVNEVVHARGLGSRDASKIRLDYWGFDRQRKFRLIKNGTLSGMVRNRQRDHRQTMSFRKAVARNAPKYCPTCYRPYNRG